MADREFFPRGVSPGMKLPYSRMAAVLVQRQIMELHDAGMSNREIAEWFGGAGPVMQVITSIVSFHKLRRGE